MKVKKHNPLFLLSILAGAATVIGGVVLWFALKRPELEDYRSYFELPASQEAKVRVTYLGVTTFLVEDGETAFLTDGFFSHPSKLRLVTGQLRPDEEVISAALERFHIRDIAAVIPLNTHFDHAMDAPVIAKKTGAILIGSSSAANLGLGYGLEAKQIRIIRTGETMRFGKFSITFLKTRASPPALLEGEIVTPFAPPAPVAKYLAGDRYTLLVEHAGRRLLIHSGGMPEETDSKAETVYLNIAGLGKQSEEYRRNFWRRLVTDVGATQVTLTQWENTFRPFGEPLRIRTVTSDKFAEAWRFLETTATKDRVRVRVPVFGQAADPFAR